MNNNANKKSQDSEKLYRMLFHCSMDGIILTDSKDRGKILSINLAACRMLGWTEEELIGKEQSVMFDLQDPALFKLLDGLAYSKIGKSRANLQAKGWNYISRRGDCLLH
jgi:PAS domain S-box-containing protein